MSQGLFGIANVSSGARRVVNVYSDTRKFTRMDLEVAAYIELRTGTLFRAERWPGVFGFAWYHFGAGVDLRVNSSSRGLTSARVGFI